MSIPSQQIGWSSQTKLMWQIAKQLERLNGLMSKVTPGSGPVSNEILTLTFDDIANADLMVGSASSLADWNTFFSLPTYGNAFTSVTVAGNSVSLKGGSEIILKPFMFGNSAQGVNLLEVVDTGCVIGCSDGVFSDFGWDAATGCYALTKVHLPSCVMLGDFTFADCTALIDLLIPFDSYESLGTSVFDNCAALPGVISFPNLKVAGVRAFAQCKLVTAFNLPSLTYIPDFLFYACESATSFDLSSSQYMNAFCFQECLSLVSTDDILLGFTVTSIPEGCFYSCSGLVTVNYPDAADIGDSAFSGCTSLTTIDFPVVGYILPNAFSGCTSMLAFDFPLAYQIYEEAFLSCTAATTFNLPNAFTIGESAFRNCTAATTFTLTDVSVIGARCFRSCTSLATLSLPACTTIGDEAFKDCTALASLSIPVCTALGVSITDNLVFTGITGNTIALTVPSALMTCYSGNPDGDIAWLQANNTVTITTV